MAFRLKKLRTTAFPSFLLSSSLRRSWSLILVTSRQKFSFSELTFLRLLKNFLKRSDDASFWEKKLILRFWSLYFCEVGSSPVKRGEKTSFRFFWVNNSKVFSRARFSYFLAGVKVNLLCYWVEDIHLGVHLPMPWCYLLLSLDAISHYYAYLIEEASFLLSKLFLRE